jgi:D-alanyl-lipoteichoic acid acyltransferase DltB (MBOAT superfamily)
MTWFRDYLYIPLGGSRVSRLVTVRNIFIVFTLSGLWHGANWTFVAWGVYNALLLSLPVLFSSTRRPAQATLRREKPSPILSLSNLPRILLTFLLMAMGWVLFRSSTIGEAVGYLTHMMTSPLPLTPCPVGKQALLWCLLLVVVEWCQRDRRHVLQFPANSFFSHRALRWTVYYLIVLLILLMHGEEQTFIYFQF